MGKKYGSHKKLRGRSGILWEPDPRGVAGDGIEVRKVVDNDMKERERESAGEEQ